MRGLLILLILFSSLTFISAWNFESNDVRVTTYTGNITNLSELQDVNVLGVTDGQALVYEDSTGKWQPLTISGIIDTDTFVDNYSDYLIIRTYALNDSRWTLNYSDYLITKAYASNDTNYNSSGLIQNWSLIIGEASDSFEANYSDYLNIKDYALNDSRWTLNYSDYLIIRTYALNDSRWTLNYSDYLITKAYASNSTGNASTGNCPIGQFVQNVTVNGVECAAASTSDTFIANYSTFLTHITWAEVINGTVTANYLNSTYTLGNITEANTSVSNWVDSVFVKISNLISLVGNWTADKPNYANYSNSTTTFQEDIGVGCDSGDFVTAVADDGTLTCETPTGGGDITAVYSNDSYILINNSASGDVYIQINETVLNSTIGIFNNSMKSYVDTLNATGLIKDWNSTGLIINWNVTGYIKDWSVDIASANSSLKNWIEAQGFLTSVSNPFDQTLNTTNNVTFNRVNASDWSNVTILESQISDLGSYIETESDPKWVANYSTFLTISAWNDTGLIRDWNVTGYIKDWNTSGILINYNSSGLIIDWNSTGFIKNWTVDINSANTSLYNWVVAQDYTAGGITWSEATNGTIYLSSNPQGFITWTNATNGTLVSLSTLLGFGYYNLTDFDIANYLNSTHTLGNITSANTSLYNWVVAQGYKTTELYNTTEEMQDAVGIALDGNFTYNDAGNSITVDSDLITWLRATLDSIYRKVSDLIGNTDIAPNTINNTQIIDGTIQDEDIAPSQINTTHITDGVILPADFNSAVNTSLDSRYVNVNGDTMTGNLNLSNVNLSISSNSYISTQDKVGNITYNGTHWIWW